MLRPPYIFTAAFLIGWAGLQILPAPTTMLAPMQERWAFLSPSPVEEVINQSESYVSVSVHGDIDSVLDSAISQSVE
ncbi:MAG: hypothetical protein ACJAZO_001961 [Myxococcota bacterium]|jgi:hypothetical protein